MPRRGACCGACKSLFTSLPVWPLHDIAAPQARTPLRALLEGDANRATLFAAVVDELIAGAMPTVVVFEDIHWVDGATLDLITFLARRFARTRPPHPDLPRREPRQRSSAAPRPG